MSAASLWLFQVISIWVTEEIQKLIHHQKSRQQIFICFSHGWITFHLYCRFFGEMSPRFNYLFLWQSLKFKWSAWHCVDWNRKCGQKNMWDKNPHPTPHPPSHSGFTTCQNNTSQWGSAFSEWLPLIFFFSVCTDKSKITQDCSHTKGAAINAFILFLTFSTHLLRVSRMRMSSVCRWRTPSIIRFPPRSPFLSISTSVSLCVSLAPSDHPHTHCQREIATSVCPVQCVMCDNTWRTRHVPAVLGFH